MKKTQFLKIKSGFAFEVPRFANIRTRGFARGGLPDEKSFARGGLPDVKSFARGGPPDAKGFATGGPPDLKSFTTGSSWPWPEA